MDLDAANDDGVLGRSSHGSPSWSHWLHHTELTMRLLALASAHSFPGPVSLALFLNSSLSCFPSPLLHVSRWPTICRTGFASTAISCYAKEAHGVAVDAVGLRGPAKKELSIPWQIRGHDLFQRVDTRDRGNATYSSSVLVLTITMAPFLPSLRGLFVGF